MKINANLNKEQNKFLEFGLEKLIVLHKEYNNSNSCDDLVSLAFQIGMYYEFYTSLLIQHMDSKVVSRLGCLYSHLAKMCQFKAFKIYNQ